MPEPPDHTNAVSPGTPASAEGKVQPVLIRAVLVFYALLWFGLLLGAEAIAEYAAPATASWLPSLLLMSPILVRAWFSPLRLKQAVFRDGWSGFRRSALEGLIASLLLPLWFGAFVLLAQRNPDLAQYLVGGKSTTDWPNFLAGMVAVAVGEELFFRGFLQQELSLAFGDRPRLGTRALGFGWLLASALFGIAHVIHQGPVGLLVFFPGLVFGYLYARRDQIVGPAIFHFSCNCMVAVAVLIGWLAPTPDEPLEPPELPAAANPPNAPSASSAPSAPTPATPDSAAPPSAAPHGAPPP